MNVAAAQLHRDTAENASRARRRSRVLRPLLMALGVIVVAIGGALYWLNGGQYVTIDDAYVQADKLALSTDVSGIVAAIPVAEGEHVKKGDVLFRLEPLKFEIALNGAKANLAQVEQTIQSMKADYQRMVRDVAAKQAQVQNDQATFDRYAYLVKTNAATRQQYDDSRFKLEADQQALSSSQMQAAAQLARLGGNPDVKPSDTPEYHQAAAQLAEAQRQLDHTVVRAPFGGIVTQVAKLQPGMYLAASTPAFGLVSDDHVWVQAQPKETELTWMKPGDRATVSVDTYPGRSWDGTVQSIAPASDQEFSILPAQNSSGNWVKVVQRIPVRVRVEQKPGEPVLRAGMSAEVTIDTGHKRTLADLF